LIQLHGTVCFPFGRKLLISAVLTKIAALHQVTFPVYGIRISTQRCKRTSGLSLASYTGHVIIITFLNAEKEVLESSAPSGESFSPHISDKGVCELRHGTILSAMTKAIQQGPSRTSSSENLLFCVTKLCHCRCPRIECKMSR
jgi:hypothetical protein